MARVQTPEQKAAAKERRKLINLTTKRKPRRKIEETALFAESREAAAQINETAPAGQNEGGLVQERAELRQELASRERWMATLSAQLDFLRQQIDHVTQRWAAAQVVYGVVSFDQAAEGLAEERAIVDQHLERIAAQFEPGGEQVG